ncbi:hypothetical protein [uncultured Psychroserpens sp.]|uniref:hypothetical protein n=1 Tax=uncultured Psychroserpens sp. TaxID=255436 RepID=UPI00260A7431|nr:hypothetical protein [uncultured Psychroserpens sp.]
MKRTQSILLFVLLLIIFACQNTKETTQEKTIEITEIPKEGVQPFAEHIFSKFTNVRDFTINTNEDEAYFSLQSPGRELSVIMSIKRENEVWQDPKISSFSGKYTDLEPFLSPDNLKLYFASNRPISKDSTNAKDYDIWYVERASVSAEWSQPKNLGAPINTEADEFYPAVASNHNLYFTCIKEELESADDIFMSQWQNNSYSKPVPLGEGVNTKGAEFNAFIAPDESYLIFGGWRRPDGIGAGDLYISKNINGTWSPAENLGAEINSKQTDFCPFVHNQTLYFTSRRSNVEQKEGGFTNVEELISEINKYDNGSSRIYKVDFKALIP